MQNGYPTRDDDDELFPEPRIPGRGENVAAAVLALLFAFAAVLCGYFTK